MAVRIVPKAWSNETWVCSIRGHVTPARTASTLRAGVDDHLGIACGTRRLARCLRCDAWVAHDAPRGSAATYDVVPDLSALPRPRRGRSLQDAIFLRLIAIDRGVHAAIFGLLAIVLAVIELKLPGLQHRAQDIIDNLNSVVNDTGRQASRDWLVRQLNHVLDLKSGTLRVLLITATIYAVIEGVEAVGLWLEKRWAEYLTVLATAGFLPFEIRELIDRVTVLRVGALVVNLAILAYLVWSKHLFGVRGGEATLGSDVDWAVLLGVASVEVPSPGARPDQEASADADDRA